MMTGASVIHIDNDVIALPSHRVISRNKIDVKLSDQQFMLVLMLANAKPHGLSPHIICERIGTAPRTIHIQRIHANHKLAAIDIRIASNRSHGGPGAIYRLETAA